MEIIIDEAIVLKMYDYGEADSIVVLLTKSHGKVRAMARGVRKPGFRAVSPVTPFSCVEIQLRQAKDDRLWTILGSRLIPGAGQDLRDLDGFHLRSYMAEVLLNTEMELAVAHRFFRLFRAVSGAMAKGGVLLPLLLYFQLWFLKLEGVLSDPAACSSCARPFASERPPAALLPLRGELVCRKCLESPASRGKYDDDPANPGVAAPGTGNPTVPDREREDEVVRLFSLYGEIFAAHPEHLEGNCLTKSMLQAVTMGLDTRIREFLLKTCRSFACLMEHIDRT